LGLPSEARQWRGFRRAYDLVSSHHALRAWHISDFGNRCELGTIETPEWNLAVENQPRSGRAVGTPTLFRPFSPMNSGFGILPRLRRDGGFFRQEASAKSEAILTNSICLIQNNMEKKNLFVCSQVNRCRGQAGFIN